MTNNDTTMNKIKVQFEKVEALIHKMNHTSSRPELEAIISNLRDLLLEIDVSVTRAQDYLIIQELTFTNYFRGTAELSQNSTG